MTTAIREAVLLVGGQGTRLRPLTVRTPKPMLPTAGVPFVHHQLAQLRAVGISHVVLATAYRPEDFRSGLGDGSALGMRIDYVHEDEPLGTGGAIRNVADLLGSGADDPVVILNADVLSGHDLAKQIEVHVDADADVTLHLTEVDDPRAFGCVPTDADGRVTAFLEKMPDPVTNRINAGCYVFRRAVVDAIPAGRRVSVERETFPALVAAGAVVLGHAAQAYWLDVGTPAAYVRGSSDLVRGVLPSGALPGPTGERLVLDGASLAADALVSGGTTVGAHVVVGPGAVVEGSVLMDGAEVGPGAVVRHCALGKGVRVGSGVVLDGVVVGDGAEIGDGNELAAGARVWCDARIPPYAIRFTPDEPNV
jgi:mannose-1-phosphate guanylyltransferase